MIPHLCSRPEKSGPNLSVQAPSDGTSSRFYLHGLPHDFTAYHLISVLMLDRTNDPLGAMLPVSTLHGPGRARRHEAGAAMGSPSGRSLRPLRPARVRGLRNPISRSIRSNLA